MVFSGPRPLAELGRYILIILGFASGYYLLRKIRRITRAAREAALTQTGDVRTLRVPLMGADCPSRASEDRFSDTEVELKEQLQRTEEVECILGRETIREAREAVKHILASNEALHELMNQHTVLDRQERVRTIRQCGHCPNGKLHYVGRNKLDDGRLGLGGLVICDNCGFHETRRG